MAPHDIEPGDVILGNDGEAMTVHAVHRYESGSVSLRQRYTSNPRGIDWSGFVGEGEDVRLLSRGVARVDSLTRTLLP